jgi:hypothetical protein
MYTTWDVLGPDVGDYPGRTSPDVVISTSTWRAYFALYAFSQIPAVNSFIRGAMNESAPLWTNEYRKRVSDEAEAAGRKG